MDNKETWMTVTKCWCSYTMHTVENSSPSNHNDFMYSVSESYSEETAIYPLTVMEIARPMIKCLLNSPCLRNSNLSLLRTVRFFVKMANCHPTRTTTACSRMISSLLATSRKNCLEETFILQCSGKAWNTLS